MNPSFGGAGGNIYQELCECVICFDVMKDPKTLLNCEHSFCKECLEELVEFKEDSTPFITCPTCRCETTLGIGQTVSQLKAQLILKKLLDEVDKSKYNKFRKDAEEKLSPKCCNLSIEWYCWDCKIFLCNTCLNMHSLSSSCVDFYQVKYSQRCESFALYCNKHNSFHAHGCLDCAATFCSYCRQEYHTKLKKKCKIVSITEYASKFKNPLNDKITLMRGYNSKQESLLAEMNLSSSLLNVEEKNMKKYIKEKKVDILSQFLVMLDLAETNIMLNFYGELKEYKILTEKLTNEIQCKVDSVQDILKHSEALAERSFIEIISQTKDVLDKFYSILPEEILEKGTNLPQFKIQVENENKKTEFSDDINNLLIATQGAFGDVQVSTINGSNYTSIERALNIKDNSAGYDPSMFTKLNDSTEAETYVLRCLEKMGIIKTNKNKSEPKKCAVSPNKLVEEIKILIGNQPSMLLRLSNLGSEYSKHFKHPLVLSEYGFKKLAQLIDSMSNSIQVIGKGTSAVITYQTSDNYPAALLIDQIADILHNCDNFAASIKEVSKALLAEKNIRVSMNQINAVATGYTEVVQVTKNRLRLTNSAALQLLKHEVAILLNGDNAKYFDSFEAQLTERFKNGFSASNYDKQDVQSLFDSFGAGFVQVVGHTGQKIITLGRFGKFYCRCMSLMKDSGGAILLNEFNSEYERIFTAPLTLEKYGFSEVEDLIESFPGLVKVYGENNTKVVVLKEKLLCPPLLSDAGKKTANVIVHEESENADNTVNAGSTVVGLTSADSETFVEVYEDEESNSIEISCEPDGTLSLGNIQTCYSDAIGLKYITATGSWRGVRLVNDTLYPPHNGWDENKYCVTLKKSEFNRDVEGEDIIEGDDNNKKGASRRSSKSKKMIRSTSDVSTHADEHAAVESTASDLSDLSLNEKNDGQTNVQRGRGWQRGRPRGGRGQQRGRCNVYRGGNPRGRGNIQPGGGGRNRGYRGRGGPQWTGMTGHHQGASILGDPTERPGGNANFRMANQLQDLSKMEFKCYRCNEHGHVVGNCPLNFK